jgi:biopolymer transport protein ExbB
MRRYATSPFRLVLLTALAIALFVIVRNASAQSPTTAPAATTTAQTSTGIFTLIKDNIDFIFITIAVLSIWGLTLIIQGFLQNRRSVYLPPATIAAIREMIANRRFPDLLSFTESDDSFISRALYPAMKRAPNFESMKEAMETSLNEQTMDQFRRIEALNIIGNLGPLLGLLGTVWGMIKAFQAMNDKGGSANPADLAGGISTALTHTFLGLFLAVPCLAAFGILRTMVDRLTTDASLTAEDLLLAMKTPETRPAPTPVAAHPPRPAVPLPNA